ncbi:MinD/ParA family protein [Kitasatospora indigofera]|uniref:MinD/ParA family ATP-binding protein n=1 Tax=Kitasatospora indigofera TaxID=67307 RepID=UPI00369D6087
MTMIALTSAKSCGVTTSALALALASPRRSLLAECDPAGGTIRTGFLQGHGTTASVGLHRLATADRSGTLPEVFEQHLVPLDGAGDRLLLPGLTDPAQASSLAGTWENLHRLLRVMEEDQFDVLVDAGRVVVDSSTRLNEVVSPAVLLRRADLVLLVVRCTASSLAAAAPVVKTLREDLDRHGAGSGALGLLLIEDGPFRPAEIGGQLGTPVVATLPHDPNTAPVLSEGGQVRGRFALAPLVRAARSAHEPITVAATRRRLQLTPRAGVRTGEVSHV